MLKASATVQQNAHGLYRAGASRLWCCGVGPHERLISRLVQMENALGPLGMHEHSAAAPVP